MNDKVAIRKSTAAAKPANWSDGAEILSAYAGLDSSSWKLGILSDFNNPDLIRQINKLAKEADVANPFFDTAFLSASAENIGHKEVQYLFLSERIGNTETLKMFAPVVLTKQGISRRPVLKVWTHLYAPLGVPLINAKDDTTIEALKNCLLSAKHTDAVTILLNMVPKQSLFTQKLYISKTLCDSCLLYTSPSPRDLSTSRMPSSA